MQEPGRAARRPAQEPSQPRVAAPAPAPAPVPAPGKGRPAPEAAVAHTSVPLVPAFAPTFGPVVFSPPLAPTVAPVHVARVNKERLSDSRLFCEIVYFLHFSLLLLVQHFHMNDLHFYRYNTWFIVLAVCLLFRRVAWLVTKPLLHTTWREAWRPATLLRVTVVLGYSMLLFRAVSELLESHSMQDFAAIFYPFLLYLGLFGLSSSTVDRIKELRATGSYRVQAVFIFMKYLSSRCLYFSFETAYICAVLPVRFQKNDHVFYSRYELMSLVAFVLLNALVIAVVELFACQHKILLLNANAIGEWALLTRGNGGVIWSPTSTYSKGDVVRYKKKVYQALYNSTSAPPGRLWVRFFNLFSRTPHTILNALLAIEAIVVSGMLIGIVLSARWHSASVWALSTLSTYSILWRLCRVRRALLPRKPKKK